MSEERGDRHHGELKDHGPIASVTDTCQTWLLEGLTNDAHTTSVHFSNARTEPNVPIENITYLSVDHCCTVTYCTEVGNPWQRWVVTPLTVQQRDLISDRQVFVLHYPFRQDRGLSEVNVPQGKSRALSDFQRMPYDERLSQRTPRFPPLPTVSDLSQEGR